MTEYCKETIRGSVPFVSFNRISCSNKAKRDGYCGLHHPDAVKRRREKSARQDAKLSAEMGAKYKREAFDLRAGDRCRELGIEPEEIKA